MTRTTTNLRFLAPVLVGFLILSAQAEVLIATNSTWWYRKGTNEASTPVEAWRAPTFPAAGWSAAPAPFYYDAEGEYRGQTHLADMRNNYTCIYLRQAFSIRDLATIESLQLKCFSDDGFALWINGVLVTTVNKTDSDFRFSATASATATEPLQWLSRALTNPGAYLVAGTNWAAVQAFNRPVTSSDFVFALELNSPVPDRDPPRIVAVDPPPGTVGSLNRITITFSEPVFGMGFSDLLVNGRPALDLSGAQPTYTFILDPPPFGPVTITWDEGARITDAASPPNRFDPTQADASWSYDLVDSAPPAMKLINPPPHNTVPALRQIEISFSEPVVGVDAADLRVNGVPASEVAGALAGPYVFIFPAPTAGPVTVSWVDGHGIRDLAAHANGFGGGSWAYIVDPEFTLAPVRLSEFLSSSSGAGGLADEDGEGTDWIELENRGTHAVNLRGWSLTDDPNEPGKWTLPDVVLPPAQWLVVFASGKDRKPVSAGSRLHTNFKLNSAGDYLGLYTAESPRRVAAEFRPAFPEQRRDYSYGFDPSGALRYYSRPTPGQANGSSPIEGVVPEVVASTPRGRFQQPFQLELTNALAGVEIRWTADGSEPTASHGQRYAGPLTISNTTILRAAGFQSNRLPSRVTTHTYLFLDQVIQQPNNPPGLPATWVDTQNRVWTADYEMDPEITQHPLYRDRMQAALESLPLISLVTDPADMFDNERGIYPKSQARGPSWERPASVELIFPETNEALQIDCGVQCQGNSVRDPVKTGKHAFRLVFKGDYGSTKLRYRLFPQSPVESFDTITLRADFNNSWLHWNHLQRPRGQRVRDAFMKDSQRAMSGFSAHNRFFHLYLNGLYWGIYDPVERPDAAFAASYLGGNKADYDVVNEGQLVDGDMTAYREMIGLSNLGDRAQYERMKQLLDLTHHIDYTLLHFYVGHEDWGQDKNWYTVRRRAPGAGFKYIAWDGELMLNSPTQNRVSSSDSASGLHTKLMANAQYRLDFADRVQRHCFNDGALTPAAVAGRYARRATEVDLAMIAESARWGDYRRDVHSYSSGPYELYTWHDHFVPERTRLLTAYFPGRTATLLEQLRSAGLYPATAKAPTFSQHGGWALPETKLTMTAPAGRIYYTTDGSDPRIPYVGEVASQASLYTNPVTLTGAVVVKARTLTGSEWSALTEAAFQIGSLGLPLHFTEIMYHPPEGDPYEFIEMQNSGPVPLDVGSFSFSGLDYLFPPGTVLAPGQIIVLASGLSPGSFAQRYPGVKVFGYFQGSLANGGERIAVRDLEFRTVCTVNYDDEGGWPTAADGQGHSLECLDPWGDPDAPAHWQASARLGGSPGAPTAPPPASPVRLHELLAASGANEADTDASDWLELHNADPTAVDLTGWSLTDNSDPRKFVFPPGTTLGATGYLVLSCGAKTARATLDTGFALARRGETVQLYDAATNRVDAVTFGVQIAGFSLGRSEQAGRWELCHPTPGTANIPATLGDPAQLTVNEWLAASPAGEEDWLELHNRDRRLPAALQGLYLATSNRTYHLLSFSFIAPGGHLQLYADESPGPDHVDFKLPASGTTISLRNQVGRTLDQVAYGPQTSGVSQGRLPDGSSTIVDFPLSATPGSPNTDQVIPNQPPLLAPIPSYRVIAGVQLVFTNAVSDPDMPAQAFTFALHEAPPGAQLAATDGIFRWRPGIAQSPSTYRFRIEVTDSGTPPLSATQPVEVTVLRPRAPELATLVWRQSGVELTVTGDVGPDYLLQTSTNLVDWETRISTTPSALPWTMTLPLSTAPHTQFFRLQLGP
jgi:hypothetical protein